MREGLIPTVLGMAVTTSGIALRVNDMKRKNAKNNF